MVGSCMKDLKEIVYPERNPLLTVNIRESVCVAFSCYTINDLIWFPIGMH